MHSMGTSVYVCVRVTIKLHCGALGSDLAFFIRFSSCLEEWALHAVDGRPCCIVPFAYLRYNMRSWLQSDALNFDDIWVSCWWTYIDESEMDKPLVWHFEFTDDGELSIWRKPGRIHIGLWTGLCWIHRLWVERSKPPAELLLVRLCVLKAQATGTTHKLCFLIWLQ